MAANRLVAIVNLVLFFLGLFLILLILIQRGKGGGLAGAFGGTGGSSAFGSRAGDTFTRITIVVAGAWILICVTLFFVYSHRQIYSGGGAGLPSDTGSPTSPSE